MLPSPLRLWQLMHVSVRRVAIHLTSAKKPSARRSRTSGTNAAAFRCEGFLASAPRASAAVPQQSTSDPRQRGA